MALRGVVDSTEGMSADIAALYKKDDATGKFTLEVDGMVDKSKVDEFRTNNVELLKKLDLYKDIDPVEAKKAADLARQVREKELIAKGDVDTIITERVTGMKTEYEGKIATTTAELQAAQSQLGVLLIDSQVRNFALKNAVLPTAADDVLLRAKSIFKIDKGVAVAMEGDKVIYGSDGVKPLTIEDWVKGLQKTAPHLFIQSTGSGSQGGRQGSGANTAGMTATQKIAAALAQD